VPRSVRSSFSERGDGDLRIDGDPAELAARRQSVAPGEWTWLHQVHGARVVEVTAPGDHAGAEADAAVTATPGAVLAVHTADCAPVLLESADATVVAAVHAGWRGLVAGVLEQAVASMERLGATDIHAQVGPHIRGRCYEFGTDELDLVADRYGDDVRTTTGWGTPALDVTAAVQSALDAVGVDVSDRGGCTACEPHRLWSHRARGDRARMAATIAIVEQGSTP
jgi:polyphenol oxidase